ncbi:MAG: SHOCT domain-containing protein [Nitrospira sp.]|nr:SHOCT domain-containing protein [Nitrospira sp.]
MEEQLSLLKRLWEQGLITEEDYRAKKQQLLDRL